MENLIELPEMKKEIDAWIKNALEKKRAERAKKMNFKDGMMTEDDTQFNQSEQQFEDTMGPGGFSRNLFDN